LIEIWYADLDSGLEDFKEGRVGKRVAKVQLQVLRGRLIGKPKISI